MARHLPGAVAEVDHGGAAELAVAQPEVEGDPERDHDVGVADGMSPAAGEGVGVVGRDRAPGEPAGEHRQPELLGAAHQRRLARVPVEVGAGEQDRALGLDEQPCHALDGVAVGLGPHPGGRVGHRGIGGGEEHVEGHVDVGGSAVGGERRRGGRLDLGGDRLRRQGRRRAPGDARHQREVVDLLERATPPARRRGAAADHEHRRSCEVGSGHRAHPVRHPGAGGEHGHAEAAGELGPALGREARGLLVAGVDHAHPTVVQPVVDGEEMPAREGEHRVDPAPVQHLGGDVPPVSLHGLSRLSLLRRRSQYANLAVAPALVSPLPPIRYGV